MEIIMEDEQHFIKAVMFTNDNGKQIFSKDLERAIEEDNASTLGLLLGHPELRYVRDSYERSLLHLSAALGNSELCKRLLELGYDVDVRDVAGNTPLLVATYFRRRAVVQLLIDAGADLFSKNLEGRSCLYYSKLFDVAGFEKFCVKRQKEEKARVKTELRRASLEIREQPFRFHRNWRGDEYDLELLQACRKEVPKDLSLFIELADAQLLVMYGKRCFICTRNFKEKLTPLQIAATALTIDDQVGRIFYETTLEDMDSAIFYAVLSRNASSLKMLLTRGANPNVRTDAANRTPLDQVVDHPYFVYVNLKSFGLAEVAKLLVAHGGRLRYHEDSYSYLIGLYDEYYQVNQNCFWETELYPLAHVLRKLIHQMYEKAHSRHRQKMRWTEPSCVGSIIVELDCMKEYKVLPGLSAYSLYQMDADGCLEYADSRARKIERTKEDSKKFPVFGEYLRLKADMIVRLSGMVEEASASLLTSLPIPIIPHIGENIVRYLDVPTLYSLAVAE